MSPNIKAPRAVRIALGRLNDAGYEAFAVGGCVRDSLLGRTPHDWDITTSATPDETVTVFSDCRLVENGRRHGTIGVLLDGMLLEITTYRNDGEYLDNRHPVQVTFSQNIADDLARRDFTVNAMAWHPDRGLVDLWGGAEDLKNGILRCVGDPTTRFCEDGLRILRAIRFASVLCFSIEEGTADAIRSCRHLLSNIAAERIREEFCKLICGAGAVEILRDYAEVIGEFLPELHRCVGFLQNSKYHCHDVYEHTLWALSFEQTGDLITRLAILLHDIGKPLCYTEDADGGHFKGHAPAGVEITDAILHRLRFDNESIARLCRLVELHDLPIPCDTCAVKRLMRKLSDEDILRLLEIKRCDRLAHAEEYRELPPELDAVPHLLREIRKSEACLTLRSLAINGDDLIALGFPKGKEIGRVLGALLEDVIDERLPNDREILLAEAKKQKTNKKEV